VRIFRGEQFSYFMCFKREFPKNLNAFKLTTITICFVQEIKRAFLRAK